MRRTLNVVRLQMINKNPFIWVPLIVLAGAVVVSVLICLGAALMAYFKPLGKQGSDQLLVDRTTNQLYVMLPGSNLLRPVYNLTSARLALGNSGTPSAVKSAFARCTSIPESWRMRTRSAARPGSS